MVIEPAKLTIDTRVVAEDIGRKEDPLRTEANRDSPLPVCNSCSGKPEVTSVPSGKRPNQYPAAIGKPVDGGREGNEETWQKLRQKGRAHPVKALLIPREMPDYRASLSAFSNGTSFKARSSGLRAWPDGVLLCAPIPISWGCVHVSPTAASIDADTAKADTAKPEVPGISVWYNPLSIIPKCNWQPNRRRRPSQSIAPLKIQSANPAHSPETHAPAPKHHPAKT